MTVTSESHPITTPSAERGIVSVAEEVGYNDKLKWNIDDRIGPELKVHKQEERKMLYRRQKRAVWRWNLPSPS